MEEANNEKHKVLHISREDARSPLSMEDYFDIDRQISKPGFKTLDGKFNWHCSCVASYVTSPCGFYFRKFLANMDKYMGPADVGIDESAKTSFDQCYSELTTCMKRYPNYYKPILKQYEETLHEALAEQISSTRS